MSHRIVPHSPWRPGKSRNGKIARLSESIRESINLMLLDGLTYEAVIKRLGSEGKTLNYHNLKRWRQGGYQDWLNSRERSAHAQFRQQCVQKIIDQSDPGTLTSTLKAARTAQELQAVLDFDPAGLEEHLKTDPAAYISLLNVIARSANSL